MGLPGNQAKRQGPLPGSSPRVLFSSTEQQPNRPTEKFIRWGKRGGGVDQLVMGLNRVKQG